MAKAPHKKQFEGALTDEEIHRQKTEIEQLFKNENFSEIVKFMKQEQCIDRVTAYYCLRCLMQFLAKLQKGEVGEPDFSVLAEIAISCGKSLGLYNESCTALDKAHLITVYFHHIIYALYEKQKFEEISLIYPVVMNLSQNISLEDNNSKKEELIKTVLELEKIIYRAAFKSCDLNKGFKMCCDVFKLYQLYPSSSNVDSVYIRLAQCWGLICVPRDEKVPSNQIQSAKELVSNVIVTHPLPQFSKNNAMKESLEKILFIILRRINNNDRKAQGDIDALISLTDKSIFPRDVVDTCLNILYSVTHFENYIPFAKCWSLINELKKKKPGLDEYISKLCLNFYECSRKVSSFVKYSVKESKECLLFLLDCLQCLQPTDIILKVDLLFSLIHHHISNDKQTPLLKAELQEFVQILIKVISTAKSSLVKVTREYNAPILQSFNTLSKIAYNLLSSNNFSEAFTVYKALLDTIFISFPGFFNEDYLLNELFSDALRSAKNIKFSLNYSNEADKEQKVSYLLESCFYIIICTYAAKANLLPQNYETLRVKSMQIWCDSKILLGDTRFQNLPDLWKTKINFIRELLANNMTEPDWQDLLSLEIYCYSTTTVEYAPHIKQAADNLKKIQSKDEIRWYSQLALSHALNQDDDNEASVVMATSVISDITLKLQSDVTKDLLAGLICAYFQQYIAEQKNQRKKYEKLADMPLLQRKAKIGPGGESTALESWENGEELSQLGQILSCRNETRSANALSQILMYAQDLSKLCLKKTDSIYIRSVLEILECVGYVWSSIGHYYSSMKTWGILFTLAEQAECTKFKLIAVANVLCRYPLVTNSAEHKWLESFMKAEMGCFDDAYVPELAHTKYYFNLCYARALMLSHKPKESADIVIHIINQINEDSVSVTTDKQELLAFGKLLATQLLTVLPANSEQKLKLIEMKIHPCKTSMWSFTALSQLVSSTRPAEREAGHWRKRELMIISCLWTATYATINGFNRLATVSLQMLLSKIQKLMLSTRVAQVLSCLGDIDLMTPEQDQLEKRLFWNQKILSLGSIVEGGKHLMKVKSDGFDDDISPSKSHRKLYQLTASCSSKCSKAKTQCSLCKNTLYHHCKAHYAYLVENNAKVFQEIYQNLRESAESQCERLWQLTWGKFMCLSSTNEATSTSAWLPFLISPVSILHCKQQLNMASREAQVNIDKALTTTESIIKELSEMNNEIAPVLLIWAKYQHVSYKLQKLGIGCFGPEMDGNFRESQKHKYDESSLEFRTPPKTPDQKIYIHELSKPVGRKIRFPTPNAPLTPVAAHLISNIPKFNIDELHSSFSDSKTPTPSKIPRPVKKGKENASPTSPSFPANYKKSNTKRVKQTKSKTDSEDIVSALSSITLDENEPQAGSSKLFKQEDAPTRKEFINENEPQAGPSKLSKRQDAPTKKEVINENEPQAGPSKSSKRQVVLTRKEGPIKTRKGRKVQEEIKGSPDITMKTRRAGRKAREISSEDDDEDEKEEKIKKVTRKKTTRKATHTKGSRKINIEAVESSIEIIESSFVEGTVEELAPKRVTRRNTKK